MASISLPRVNYTPGTQTGLESVNLTEPGTIVFPAGASSFPSTTDNFKTLTYSAPSNDKMKTKLAEYHSLMAKVTGGTGSEADLTKLKTIMGDIKEHVLTEDDLNLMVDALSKIEEYLYTYLKTDLSNKAKKMDEVLGGFITALNNFMISLETQYADSPENYPIPMKSIYFNKLEDRLQKAIAYEEGTLGTVVAASKPANPSGRAFVWIDTNISDAD